MADLLPCPFCGGTDAHSVGDAILCDGCEALGPDGYTEDDARTRWNTRADDSPPPADAELLALANRTLAADFDKARALLTAAVPGLERDALRSGNGDVLTRVRAWLGVGDG